MSRLRSPFLLDAEFAISELFTSKIHQKAEIIHLQKYL